DIDLDALENAKGLQPFVEGIDLDVLFGERAAGVIGDGEIVVATGLRRKHHPLERVASVRPGRVRMQIALDVTELDELRQLALARSLELTCVLPQLGRDELVAELFVYLRLVGERQLFARL